MSEIDVPPAVAAFMQVDADLAAARAEVAALRSAVGAALSDRITASLGTADWAIVDGRPYASVNPDWLRAIVAEARSVRAALAPVSSSGEAESGEDRDPADYGPSDDRDADPEETICCTCGHVAVEHTKGRYSIYGVCPAPVSSGGQADGEGEGPSLADRVAVNLALPPEERDADDVHDLIARLRVAARPVLSREAVVTTLSEHRPLIAGDVPCECGVERQWHTRVGYLGHLADVLTAGGEQA